MLSKKATKIDVIFTVDLTLCSKCQITGEDFVNFCGLLGKHELYLNTLNSTFSGTQLNILDVKRKLFSIGFFLAVLSNILTFSFLNKKLRKC